MGFLLALGCAAPALAQVEAEFKDEYDTSASAPPKAEAETPAPAAAPAPAPVPAEQPAAPAPAASAPEPARAHVALDTEAPKLKPEQTPQGEGAEVKETADAQALRAQNTWFGSTGGLHVVDAGSGPPETLRLQLGVDFFTSSNYLLAGDKDQYSGGTLSLSWTVADHVELFGSLANHANYNEQDDPHLLQVLGDALLGIKAYDTVIPWLTLGGDFSTVVLNTVGDIGPVFSALSFGFRGNASADFRKLDEPVPLIGRFNIGYFFDNSSNLITDVENQRYAALGAVARDRPYEDRNLIRRVERFALGINRVDNFNLGLGFEAPLKAAEDFFVHPMLEWTLQVPVNRQSYSCLRVDTRAGPADPDGCLKVVGFSAMPSNFTLGARVFPPVKGLSFALGVDISVSGSSRFVRELAPNKPYDVLIALAYAIDTREKPPVVRVELVKEEISKAEPPKPRVAGAVVDALSGAGVGGAAVRYPDGVLTAQMTDEQGKFLSYELPAGEARFDISHPDYEPRSCAVMIPEPPKANAPAPKPSKPEAQAAGAAGEGGPALGHKPAPPVVNPYLGKGAGAGATPPAPEPIALRCELTPKPRAGSIRGQVTTEAGKAVAGAHVELTGPSSQSSVSDTQGQFAVVSAVAGSYAIRVEADGYLIRLVSVDVKPGETATPEITLVTKPKEAQVELTKQEVRIRKQIFFKLNSAEISEKSNTLLSEIADVLLRNPQVKQVEIQGHTDNRGSPEVNQQLSQLRADAVRAWLLNAGVDAARLTSKGYGDTHPLEPNLTERHRARNRRVQFIIKSQD